MALKLKETYIVCPNCGEKIMKPADNGLILRNRILFMRDSGTYAKCKKCGKEIKVPIGLTN